MKNKTEAESCIFSDFTECLWVSHLNSCELLNFFSQIVALLLNKAKMWACTHSVCKQTVHALAIQGGKYLCMPKAF